MMRRLRTVAAALAAAAALAPGARAAPTLVTKACPRYVPGAKPARYVSVAGAGFTPNARVRLAYAGAGRRATPDVVRTDARGSFATTASGPAPRALARFLALVALTATDAPDPALHATARFHVVRLGVRLPRDARPADVVPYRLYGFPAGTVWAHYVFGGTPVATARIGAVHGPCGTLAVRRRYLPARVRYGTWHLYFSLRETFTAGDVRHRRFVLAVSFRVRRRHLFTFP